ncbi:MAG: hypothetical protein ACP5QG_04430 [candidate division WOR-3 bacterium]
MSALIGIRLNAATTTYELGFSKPVEVNPPFHFCWGEVVII